MNTFDPKKVSAVANGMFLTGFMDGTMITAEKNEDSITPHVGAQGDVTFAHSADESGTITVTLKQDSASLPELIRLANNKTVFPINIVDANTNRFRVGGNNAVILRVPALEWGAEVTGVEISIYVADFNLAI